MDNTGIEHVEHMLRVALLNIEELKLAQNAQIALYSAGRVECVLKEASRYLTSELNELEFAVYGGHGSLTK